MTWTVEYALVLRDSAGRYLGPSEWKPFLVASTRAAAVAFAERSVELGMFARIREEPLS